MKLRGYTSHVRKSWLPILFLVGFLGVANAQEYEIHPYAGAFFPEKFLNLITVQNKAIYGLKAGIYVTGNFEAEANYGFINNLSFENTLTKTKAHIWEGSASYHVGGTPRFYGTVGFGGVTTNVSDDSQTLFGPNTSATEMFFSVSYGGGIKLLRMFGPVGFRADVRGRTLPRYYGFRFSWLETTAGLSFSFGER